MPQYSNSFLLQDGGTVNAVFNTESNTITYNVTTPQGQTATLTLPPDADPQSVTNLNNIRQQIRNQGGSALTIIGFGQGLQAVKYNTNQEASRAEASAIANNTTVPANPTPPPPVAPAEPVIVNTPSTNDNVVNPNTDPNLNLGNETVNSSPQQSTNIVLGTNPLNEFATDTNLVVQGIDFAPAATEPLPEQQSTNIVLGTNPLNEFATDTSLVSDDVPVNNDAGGEDVIIAQRSANEGNLLAEDNILSDNDNVSADEDPNLTALEAGDNESIESDDNVPADEDPNLTALEAGDNENIESDDDNVSGDEDPNLTALEAGDNESIESDDDNVPGDEDPNLTALEAGDLDDIVINQGQPTINDDDGNDTDQVESTDPAGTTTTNTRGITTSVSNTRNQADLQYGINFAQLEDWRVRLKLAPSANYLYKATDPGILAPLKATDGVIFPYTPQVTVNYVANYDPTNPTHSNYKILQYQNSSVDSIQIACDFTAQDTQEANYLLATIHFFRSVTKMFYGQDQNPKRGTPPPLCYLKGLGAFQFDMHPLVVTSFAYTLPDDVDYIRAMSSTAPVGASVNNSGQGTTNNTLNGTGVTPGGLAPSATFNNQTNNQLSEPTYVPTKIKLTIMCMPVVSRKDISDTFSLKDYAKGTLLQGSKRSGGGIW